MDYSNTKWDNCQESHVDLSFKVVWKRQLTQNNGGRRCSQRACVSQYVVSDNMGGRGESKQEKKRSITLILSCWLFER